MLQVLSSPRSADRFSLAADFVRGFPPGTEVLLIGPSRGAVDDFARGLAASMERGASFGLHRATLTQIAARLATCELSARGLSHGTRLGAEATAERAVFEALEEGALSYFAPVARFPNFARAASATLQEIRLDGTTPARLAETGPAGRDLAVLLARFEEKLESAGVADRALLLRAAEAALEGRRDRLAEATAVMPKLFLDTQVTSRAEAALVRALVARAASALATVPDGDDRSLEAFCGIPGAEHVRLPVPEGSPLGRLQARLFSSEELDPAEAGEGVSFFSAPGEGRECVEIARRIQEEAKRGVPLEEIAIFVRAPETYGDLLEHALRRASVPAYFSFGSRRPHPSGRAFLALLSCGAEGLSARRFAEYLSLGQVPFLTATGEPPPAGHAWTPPSAEGFGPMSDPLRAADSVPEDALSDAAPISTDSPAPHGTLRAPRRWERLIVESSVLGGKDRWARRLAGLEEELRQRAEQLARTDPESKELVVRRRELADLGHLARFALPVIELLASFRGEASWGDWLARLESLAPRVLRRPEAVLSLLSELRPMARVGPVGLEEVRQVLSEALGTVQEPPPRGRGGRVFVGTAADARGRSFTVVFVPGLAERLFPKKPREDPMLLDVHRVALMQSGEGVRLDTQADRAKSERLLLRLSAGAATRTIHLSYPRLEVAEARPRVPSFYGLDVLRATTGTIPDSETIERDAASAANARLAWPAPDLPLHAIDDAEHDLSVLGPLLRSRDPEARRGRAAYLLTQNQHLARSLRTRWARWESPKWGPADGLVAPGEQALAALARRRPTERPYSVSALQHFAACPYRFYLSAILGLAPRREPAFAEQMDPMTRGSLFHKVQARVLSRLRDEGALALFPEGVDSALRVLDEELDAAAEEERDRLAPPILRVFHDEIERMRADLQVWLRRTAEKAGEWTPLCFELELGLAGAEERGGSAEPALVDGRFLIRGAIDLVERSPRTGALRVTDYKTGLDTTRPGLTIGGGEVLQPVLYSLAVEALPRAFRGGGPAPTSPEDTSSEEGRVTEARLFFCTARGGFAERPVALDERARAAGLSVLELVDSAVACGFLPPLPRRGACEGCQFRGVCGPHEEERSARKNSRSLPPLAPFDELARLRDCP